MGLVSESILTPDQIRAIEDSTPGEVMFALHKRMVSAEKLIAQYRDLLQDTLVEVQMLKDKVKELESVQGRYKTKES